MTLKRLLICFVIIILASVSFFFHFRCDLSRGKLYTLSAYSRECVSLLDSEMVITWYRSQDLAHMTPAVRYIEDFIEEYRLASHGMISFTVRNPASSESIASIESLGIVPRQSGITSIYSGLLVEYRGANRVIPFLLDTKTLEYDLTRLILELQSIDDPETVTRHTVQLAIGNASDKIDYRYLEAWMSYAGFTITNLYGNFTDLDPAKPLLVIGSSDFTEESVIAMDAFLAKGGNAAFFVSGNAVNASSDWTARPKAQDALLTMLSRHGFLVEPALVMDVLNFRVTMPSIDGSKYQYVNYPFWVTVPRINMVSSEPCFFGVEKLEFFWPSQILVDTTSQNNILPLVRATAGATVMVEPYDTNPFGDPSIHKARSAKGAILAACVKSPGRMMVVGDEYLPSSLVDYSGSDANLDFTVSVVEWLVGSDRLLALKGRVPPDTRIEGDESTPESEDAPDVGDAASSTERALSRSRIVNLVCIPGCCVLFMVWILARRKKNQ